MQEDDKIKRGWERTGKEISVITRKKGQLIGEGDLNVGEGESKDTLVYIGCC